MVDIELIENSQARGCMRPILRKLDRGQTLDAAEYELLMNYFEDMGRRSPQSYLQLYHQYAEILEQDYSTFLPRFWYSFDDLLNYLLSHRDSIQSLLQGKIAWDKFPSELQPYLKHTFNDEGSSVFLKKLLSWLDRQDLTMKELPRARIGEVTCIYEDGNPYKEMGIKCHFDRLARYTFISRLQTYRYLARSKARSDKFEVIASDRLGGIFTNKEKSIYYFIYLSEDDPVKAENACRVLNMAFGKYQAREENIEHEKHQSQP